ncbi:MAG: sulfatase [Planctomycetota bacterium]
MMIFKNQSNTLRHFLIVACVVLSDALVTSLHAGDGRPPNVLFILTDDQGWPTLGCYGNEHVATPNLDRLASQGIRFTNAYVMPQCTPTRAALLTGQPTARYGMWHVIGWYGTPFARISEPPYRENLAPEDCRLPRMFQSADYATGMAGKWHLTNGSDGNYVSLKLNAAHKYGFEEVAQPGPGSQNEGDKWVDYLTDQTIAFIERHQYEPWFFYLAHHTLHGKVSAPDDLISEYLDRGAPSEGLQNATYLAAIDHLDRSVGRLTQALDDLGLTENTIVVFLSDNGGVDTVLNPPHLSDDPLDGSQALRIRESQFNNEPLREGKGSLYEGGIRVPCLMRWPKVVQPGLVENTPIHVIDWLPTLTHAAGLSDGDGQDGMSLMPLFTSTAIDQRDLYWYTPLYDLRWGCTPSAAIRRGNWKLIESFGDFVDEQRRYREEPKIELFDLVSDPGEANDLSTKHPELTSRLREDLRQWITDSGAVIPTTNPHHAPEKALFETREKPNWYVDFESTVK